MEAKWLEDFIALAQTRSFTRAADRCHSSQSALSRRIQALERWVGSPLVDRDAYPLELTEAGQRFLAVAVGLQGSVEAARQIVKTHHSAAAAPVRVLMQPDINPALLADALLRADDDALPLNTRIATACAQECFSRLASDEADLLVLQQHATLPLVMDLLRHQTLSVAHEAFVLCGRADLRRRLAAHDEASGPLTMIEYAPSTYLAQVAAMLVSGAGRPAGVRRGCEADNAATVLAMVRAGAGVGFVPGSWVHDDIERGHLFALGAQWQSELETVVVREAASTRRSSLHQQRKAVDGLWAKLERSFSSMTFTRGAMHAPHAHAVNALHMPRHDASACEWRMASHQPAFDRTRAGISNEPALDARL